MSRSVTAYFVLGYGLDYWNSNDPLPDCVKAAFEEDGEAWISGELKVDGLSFQYFYCFEEAAAFGVEVEWGIDCVSKFDTEALNTKVAKLQPQVKKVFDRWGLAIDPELLLVLDYS